MSIHGRFVWEELMTTDVASAVKFYGKVAGLKSEKAAFDPNYTVFKGSGGSMGGVMALPAEAEQGGTPPMWISYIGTNNTDETARKIAQFGGKVHKQPWAVGDGGRVAIVADPQGAVFALYSNPKATQAPPTPIGHASWHELATSDYIAAFSFYQNVFGWRVINDMDMGPAMGVYRLFGAEGSTDSEMLGGMYTKPAQQPGPPAWLPYIKVANVVTATAAAKKLGAFIMHGPADVPGGKITMATDPQKVMFAIHQVIPPAAAKPSKKAPAKKKTAAKRTTKNVKKKAAPKKKRAGAKK